MGKVFIGLNSMRTLVWRGLSLESARRNPHRLLPVGLTSTKGVLSEGMLLALLEREERK